MRAIARAARVMEIARKRVMARDNDNETTATETRTTTITTMATNTMMLTTMLTKTMMKKTSKMTITTVQQRWLAVAGGSRGGQQRRRQRGVSVHIFLSKLNSGCSWLVVGEGQVRQAGSIKNPPRKVHVRRN
jgi:hypothetical protein